jgi:hypothetical protein
MVVLFRGDMVFPFGLSRRDASDSEHAEDVTASWLLMA